MAAKKQRKRKYGKSVQKDVETEMRRYKKGKARSGKGLAKVKSRKQAIAIALSKARKEGKKVPKKVAKKRVTRKKSTSRSK